VEFPRRWSRARLPPLLGCFRRPHGAHPLSSFGPATYTGLLLFSAYVVGQLIALCKACAENWRVELVKPRQKAQSGAYDYLRLYYKDAGSQCAKIRAEFTMYNGLATVFFGKLGFLSMYVYSGVASPHYPASHYVATGIRGRNKRGHVRENR